MTNVRAVWKRCLLGLLVALPAIGAGSSAFAYISNRMFFQAERALAERRAAIAHGQADPNSMLNWRGPRSGQNGRVPGYGGQGSSGGYKVARAGQPLKIAWYSSLTPDCRSEGSTAINVVSAPAGGRIYSRTGSEYPNFPTSNTHSVCNRQRVRSTVVYYSPQPGFTGTDRFTIENVFPSGNAQQHSYVVSVR